MDSILAVYAEVVSIYFLLFVKISAPGRRVIRRATIEEQTGQRFNLQQLHVNLVTLSGYIDEDDDEVSLSWEH